MWLAVLQIENRDINKEKCDPFFMAVAYTYAGDKDKALISLERAFHERSFGITTRRSIACAPILVSKTLFSACDNLNK
jgi:hypothetical protein